MAADYPIKPSPYCKDVTAQKYGRLYVDAFVGVAKSKSIFKCICDCGTILVVTGNALRSGNTTSCGCIGKEHARRMGLNNRGKEGKHRTHGMSSTVEYRAWKQAKSRCFNPHNKKYADYGGRGIVMCQEWSESFQSFFIHVGPKPAGTSLDRVDVNGNYEPGNVRWAKPSTQAQNVRRAIIVTHKDESIYLNQLARRESIPYLTLYTRYRKGQVLIP